MKINPAPFIIAPLIVAGAYFLGGSVAAGITCLVLAVLITIANVD
jgi:hypothetical protein